MDNDNAFQKTGENTYNSHQTTGGHTFNSYQETSGNTHNSYQTTGNEWYMRGIKLKKYPNTTKLIKTAGKDWRLTIVEFASWCANNPERVKEIMGKEFVK